MKPRLRRALFAAALAVATTTPAAAQDFEEDIQAQRERLEQLQAEIAGRREEAERLGQQESSVLRELRQVERELGVTQDLILALEREIADRSDQIVSVTRDLARAQDELALKRQVLARRLRSIYILGQFGDFEILLGARSFAEILSRYKYLRLIAGQDRRLVNRISSLEASIRRDRQSLESARDELAEAHDKRTEQARSLSAGEVERQGMLRRVKEERSEQLNAAAELEAETQRIQTVLATLERRRAEREEMARREAIGAGRSAPTPVESTLTGDFGNLDWPVEGEIIERFGRSIHPVYRTQVINNGIDIRAQRGSPVRTVESGEVAYADWNGGYGLTVIVDHDGGHYSIYSHLDRVNVAIGQRVEKRQVIGTVGESGSLVGPKLHFEIRKGRQAVDPIGWLRAR